MAVVEHATFGDEACGIWQQAGPPRPLKFCLGWGAKPEPVKLQLLPPGGAPCPCAQRGLSNLQASSREAKNRIEKLRRFLLATLCRMAAPSSRCSWHDADLLGLRSFEDRFLKLAKPAWRQHAIVVVSRDRAEIGTGPNKIVWLGHSGSEHWKIKVKIR